MPYHVLLPLPRSQAEMMVILEKVTRILEPVSMGRMAASLLQSRDPPLYAHLLKLFYSPAALLEKSAATFASSSKGGGVMSVIGLFRWLTEEGLVGLVRQQVKAGMGDNHP